MDRNTLAGLRYDRGHIEAMRKAVHEAIISRSKNIREGDFNAIGLADMKLMFDLYDELFLGRYFSDVSATKVVFRLSKRATRAAGKTAFYADGAVVIALSSYLLFMTFGDVKRDIRVNGVACRDRLEAAQLVFEHELVHLLEHELHGATSCSGSRFGAIAMAIFGHTEVTHQLVIQAERAREIYGVKIGDTVEFELEGRTMRGLVSRVTKRATVMVEDPEGPWTDGKGKKYIKCYIPLQMLRRQG